MSWKKLGSHPIIVGVGLIGGIASIVGLIISLKPESQPLINNNGASIQIGGSKNTINNKSQRDILNVPCFNGGGSGGWMFEPGLPKEYFPISILKVQGWPIRSYSDHPMYKSGSKFAKYGTCSIVPSRASGFNFGVKPL